MTASSGKVLGQIFMSYRREDTAYPAGWLYDRLARRFGRTRVFKDIDSIALGDDFAEMITAAVGSCDVLLALIGDGWLTVTGQDGRRRLDNPADFVRLEIEAALTRNVRVIPVLVAGARMPSEDQLPASLAKLAGRQALELTPSRFDADARRLLRVLRRTFAEAQEQARQEAEEAAAPDTAAPVTVSALDVSPADDGHYQELVDEADNLVIFLGAGVNADEREGPFQAGSSMLPDDTDIADYLAVKARLNSGGRELAEAAQHASMIRGAPRVLEWVKQLVSTDAEPGSVHKYLACFPKRLDGLGLSKRYPMIVTSKLDLALERAFREENEPFDVALYMAPGTEYAGKFVHLPWGGMPQPVITPERYTGFPISAGGELTRTVIVRTNGAVDDLNLGYPWEGNFVITEDQYIDYQRGAQPRRWCLFRSLRSCVRRVPCSSATK